MNVVAERRPTLWRCTGCLYGFWSHGEEQDPQEDHCSNGRWVKDGAAIDALTDAMWSDWRREYWMAP